MERLGVWWNTRAPRERRVLIAAAILLMLMILLSAFDALYSDRSRLLRQRPALLDQRHALQAHAVEIEQLRSRVTVSTGEMALADLLKRRLESGGYGGTAARIESQGVEGVVITFPSVAFPDWLRWVVGLREQRIRIASCRIEALPTPGMVVIKATFARGAGTE